jgi:uncharacterized protein (TIGR02145 family)
MKKGVLSMVLVLLYILSFAQVPESFNYQAIPRNASGGAYPDQAMKGRFSILAGTSAGLSVYVETFSSTTTNLGILNLQVGKGTPVSGSFSTINWGGNSYFLKVEIDVTGGTSYVEMGTTQLLSVPYAMHSKTSQTTTDAVNTTGDQTIAGNKTFIGTTKVINPVSAADAVTKDYVDKLQSQITALENSLIVGLKIVKDVEGNIYNTVKIGNQLWMAENLKTTKYLNGDIIETTSPVSKDITSESIPKYQWSYGGNESNVSAYGRLYTWYAVTDIRKICPSGWHVPSISDWITLTTFLGGESIAGDKLKEAGSVHWYSNNNATNETGFTALPGGYRYNTGPFGGVTLWGIWWTNSQSAANTANVVEMNDQNSNSQNTEKNMNHGFSVRCIKDL